MSQETDGLSRFQPSLRVRFSQVVPRGCRSVGPVFRKGSSALETESSKVVGFFIFTSETPLYKKKIHIFIGSMGPTFVPGSIHSHYFHIIGEKLINPSPGRGL